MKNKNEGEMQKQKNNFKYKTDHQKFSHILLGCLMAGSYEPGIILVGVSSLEFT